MNDADDPLVGKKKNQQLELTCDPSRTALGNEKFFMKCKDFGRKILALGLFDLAT